jgi:hypothetical protein
MLRIAHCLDNRLTDGGKVVSPTHRPHFTPQKHYYFSISGTHFCKPQGLERQKRLGNFKNFSSSSDLGSFLYLIYAADLPTSPTAIATFADDTAVLVSDSEPATASQQLQTHHNAIQSWLQKWRMQANTHKSLHVTFTTRTGMCSPVT